MAVRLSIRVSEELDAKLRQRAQDYGMTVSGLARALLRRELHGSPEPLTTEELRARLRERELNAQKWRRLPSTLGRSDPG